MNLYLFLNVSIKRKTSFLSVEDTFTYITSCSVSPLPFPDDHFYGKTRAYHYPIVFKLTISNQLSIHCSFKRIEQLVNRYTGCPSNYGIIDNEKKYRKYKVTFFRMVFRFWANRKLNSILSETKCSMKKSYFIFSLYVFT